MTNGHGSTPRQVWARVECVGRGDRGPYHWTEACLVRAGSLVAIDRERAAASRICGRANCARRAPAVEPLLGVIPKGHRARPTAQLLPSTRRVIVLGGPPRAAPPPSTASWSSGHHEAAACPASPSADTREVCGGLAPKPAAGRRPPG